VRLAGVVEHCTADQRFSNTSVPIHLVCAD
jgi:hypothetical protein